MAEAKHFWLPRSFQPYALTAKINAFEGLSQMKISDTSRQEIPYDDYGLHMSLRQFTNDFAKRGDLDHLLDKYLKKDSPLDSRKFKLVAYPGGSGRGGEPPYDQFFFDGFTNLILFYGDPEKGIGVSAGINRVKNLNNIRIPKKVKWHDLIINQLQGPAVGGNNLEVEETFKQFRWERLLTEVFIKWARNIGLKRIFMLPHDLNGWKKIRKNEHGTSYLRYDVTAKRLGFKRDLDDEPYFLLLNINMETRDLFKAIFQQS